MRAEELNNPHTDTLLTDCVCYCQAHCSSGSVIRVKVCMCVCLCFMGEDTERIRQLEGKNNGKRDRDGERGREKIYF